MSKKKSGKNSPVNIAKMIKEWTDEEVLINLTPFFDRINLGVDFIEDDDGLITHQVLCVVAGDKLIASEMKELDWPMQRLPIPEAFKGTIN